MFLIVLMLSSRAQASAILIDNKTIAVPVSDAKVLLAEHAYMEAEINALREALTSERANNLDILKKTEEFVNVTDKQIVLLKEQNAILSEEVSTLKKNVKFERAKGLGTGVVIGVILGIGIGLSIK